MFFGDDVHDGGYRFVDDGHWLSIDDRELQRASRSAPAMNEWKDVPAAVDVSVDFAQSELWTQGQKKLK